ncbi:MAG: M23 family metallopeptidase [Hyphomonadaceae bacterium]|nr:M23 family metallopeptidase [Hyphomonadaceae bacterium]
MILILRFVLGAAVSLSMMFIGWVAGSFYPAPPTITGPVAERAPILAAQLGIDRIDVDSLRAMLSQERFAVLRREASAMAARAGDAIIVERIDDADAIERSDATDVALIQPEPVTPRSASTFFEDQLRLCPRMTVSNAPRTDASGRVENFRKFVNVNGVTLAVNPTNGACLSSAFGPRGGRTHRGVDYHSAEGGPIAAAADGVVIERKYRDDYGNMLLIDHGNGVYTRYAHLSSFAAGVVEGAQVTAGQQIGLMGNTAAYQIPIHLHYELLLGDYANPRASFGLEAQSPFAFPAAG